MAQAHEETPFEGFVPTPEELAAQITEEKKAQRKLFLALAIPIITVVGVAFCFLVLSNLTAAGIAALIGIGVSCAA